MIKTCIICGKTFESNYPNKVTCSNDCAHTHQLQRQRQYWRQKVRHKVIPKVFYPKTCVICGKEFTPQYKGQKYCSDYCRDDPKARLLRRFFTMAIQKLELKGEGKLDCHYSRR